MLVINNLSLYGTVIHQKGFLNTQVLNFNLNIITDSKIFLLTNYETNESRKYP